MRHCKQADGAEVRSSKVARSLGRVQAPINGPRSGASIGAAQGEQTGERGLRPNGAHKASSHAAVHPCSYQSFQGLPRQLVTLRDPQAQHIIIFIAGRCL